MSCPVERECVKFAIKINVSFQKLLQQHRFTIYHDLLLNLRTRAVR
jgi:hypothetical protein